MEESKEEQRYERDENEKLNYRCRESAYRIKSAVETYGLHLLPRPNQRKKKELLIKGLNDLAFGHPSHVVPFFKSNLDFVFVKQAEIGFPRREEEILVDVMKQGIGEDLACTSHAIRKDSKPKRREDDPFRCDLPGCSRSYHTLARFQQHFAHYHRKLRAPAAPNGPNLPI
eukprot:TRINITY_DN7787_c0_g1_i3.p1 TRINITY_DN7787_c0_g1~~TRINITY_DN7787_c0_g1_i3.p1  ORF type:complete len:171 (-),score=22.69 TRINITY_DN7787_c0_g1_i3:97-609(-)